MALPTEDVLLYSMLAFIVVENFIEIYLSLRQVKVYKESKKVPAELVDTIKPDTFEKVLMTLYPVFIAPLFDKYSPLEVGPLRTSIEELAAKLKFPLAQLYVVEGSKRSAHSNAYFYGLWGSKRIVLFDTLLVNKGKTQTTEGVDNTNETEKLTDDEHSKSRTLLKQTLRAESEEKETENFKENYNENVGKGCKDEEVLAVLAHELGHWKLGHVTKNIIFMQFHLLLMFVTFAYLFKYDPLYRAVGFRVGERPVLVGLLLIVSYVLGPYNALINFLMTIVSRTFEYQADAFANDLGYSKELAKALIKLNIDNLGFPVYDWMYSAWNHSHPTLLQRIDRLKDINNDIKKSN
ncbi:CAAX prenyl protease 1 homolog isoform X2 [Contarinia nasturtii]|uniref:CAAX prenyl protease 1 homolog isoform X2 n=1 Tax=Contarinia nasturtii TaxID=265458 RepID=UPI0012D4082B|nr:CAAX prenyl protease 1 homolog isoform X2 [Contarinia nasturtii]